MIKSLVSRCIRPLALTALATGIAMSAQAGTLSIGHTTWVGYGTLYLAQDLGWTCPYQTGHQLPVKLMLLPNA